MLELDAVARVLPTLIDTTGRKSTRCSRRRKLGKEFHHKAGRHRRQGPASGFPSGGGESRGRGAVDRRKLRRWRKHLGGQRASGGDRRKAEDKCAGKTRLFPVRRARLREAPNPVRNTHGTQGLLTRRLPSRRRPQRLCARRRGRPRRGRGQLVVTGPAPAEGAASTLLLRVLGFWARPLPAAGAADLGSCWLVAVAGSASLPLAKAGGLP